MSDEVRRRRNLFGVAWSDMNQAVLDALEHTSSMTSQERVNYALGMTGCMTATIESIVGQREMWEMMAAIGDVYRKKLAAGNGEKT